MNPRVTGGRIQPRVDQGRHADPTPVDRNIAILIHRDWWVPVLWRHRRPLT